MLFEHGRISQNRVGRLWAGALSLVLVVLIAAGANTASAAARSTGPRYYVSLGDSYSVGYQPAPVAGATSGYTAVVAAATHLTLANFGCGGATTTSILETVGCSGLPATSGAITYPTTTQAAGADAFFRRHRGEVGLITVSIGGNDVTHCAASPDPIACVASAVVTIRSNVNQLALDLRAAAGPHVPIIGITYPDVILGLWVYPPGQSNQSLAKLSVVAFRTLLNPALTTAYQRAGGSLVDVTAATDAYQPLTRTVDLPAYGAIPAAVARVCELTWYCARGDIHARTAGYHLIGRLIDTAYRRVTA
jgi:lysophospholipase L1-like esterase